MRQGTAPETRARIHRWHDAGVVQRTNVHRHPVDYLASGEWPSGPLTADAPVAAEYARQISQSLGRRLEGESISDVARRAGLARSTIQRLLAGTSWGDVVTLASLESALQAPLWPTPPPSRSAQVRR